MGVYDRKEDVGFNPLHDNDSLYHATKCVLKIFLSMRYWNERQTQLFVEKYWIILHKTLLKIADNTNGFLTNEMKDLLHDVVFGILWKIIVRFKALNIPRFKHAKQIATWRNNNNKAKLIERNKVRRVYFERAIQSKESPITCGYHACNAKQCTDSELFKICSGCKLVYFCSKSCQKKAWKDGHRRVCRKLQSKYSL